MTAPQEKFFKFVNEHTEDFICRLTEAVGIQR